MIFNRLGLILNRESRRGVAPSKTPLPLLKKERGHRSKTLRGVRLFHKNQLGFTLVEIMLAIAVAGVITGGITMTIFQVFDANARTSNHMTAIRQVQNAGCQVSRDAQMAQGEPVIGDDPATPGVTEFLTLTWTEWDSSDVHQVVYSLEDRPSSSLKNLQGVHYINGEESDRTPVFEFIDPDQTSCDWDGSVLTFKVTATVGSGSSQEQSETRIYEVVPRPGS